MAEFYIDILEPNSEDVDASMQLLSNSISNLYAEYWAKEQQPYYEKAFNPHIQALANMWFSKAMKVFVAFERGTDKALGFVTAVPFRPLAYNAQVLQIQDYYAAGDTALENALLEHISSAAKILGCDELWVGKSPKVDEIALGSSWKKMNDFVISRYVRSA